MPGVDAYWTERTPPLALHATFPAWLVQRPDARGAIGPGKVVKVKRAFHADSGQFLTEGLLGTVQETGDQGSVWIHFESFSQQKLVATGNFPNLEVVCPYQEVTAQYEDYGGVRGKRNPEEEKGRLESAEAEELAKWTADGRQAPRRPVEQDRHDMVHKLATGAVTAFDESKLERDSQGRVVPGTGYTSLATAGLPGNGADFVVGSSPGANMDWFSSMAFYCALFGIGLAVVFEKHWGAIWFKVWKQNVDHFAAQGKTIIVLTLEGGKIGFAQTMEVLYLIERGYRFVVMPLKEFLVSMDPVGGCARSAYHPGGVDRLAHVLAEVPKAGAPPRRGVVDQCGRSPFHGLAEQPNPRRAFELIHQTREYDIDSRDFHADTPMMLAAQFGCAEQVEILLDLGADSTLKNARGYTSLALAEYFAGRGTPGCAEAAAILRSRGAM